VAPLPITSAPPLRLVANIAYLERSIFYTGGVCCVDLHLCVCSRGGWWLTLAVSVSLVSVQGGAESESGGVVAGRRCVYRGMRLEVYIGTRRDLRGLRCGDPAAGVWFSEICVEKAPTYHVTEAVTGPKELAGTGAGLNWASEGDSIQTNTYLRRWWRQKAPN